MILTPLERQEWSIFLQNNAYLDERHRCWLCKFYKFHGYCRIRFQGKFIQIHRLAYAVFNGNFEDHWCVLHKCDVRHCFYPGHLFLGTRRINAEDRDAKGRTAKGANHYRFGNGYLIIGQKNGRTKLKDFQIPEIKAKSVTGLSNRELAKQYGVHFSTINSVINGETWKHIP